MENGPKPKVGGREEAGRGKGLRSFKFSVSSGFLIRASARIDEGGSRRNSNFNAKTLSRKQDGEVYPHRRRAGQGFTHPPPLRSRLRPFGLRRGRFAQILM